MRFESYFNRWDSVLVLASPKDYTGVPRFQHKTCKGFVPVRSDRTPPRICPHCDADTAKEQTDIEIAEKHGAVIFEDTNKNLGFKKGEADKKPDEI